MTPSTAAAGTTAAFDPATGVVTIKGAVAGTSVDIWLVYYGTTSDVTDPNVTDPDTPSEPTEPGKDPDDVTGEQPGWDKPVPPTAPRAVGRTLAANEKVPGQEYPYWVFIPTGREIDYAMINGTRYAANQFEFDEATAGQFPGQDLYSVNLKFGFSYTISIRLVSKTGPVTPTEVSAVAITWDTTTPVELNGTLPEATSTTAGVDVKTEWKDAEGNVVTTAAAYGTYTGKVTVTAKDGYKLAENVAYTVNGTATTNLTAEITVADPTVEPTEVSAVEITWDTKTAVAIDGTLPVASTETEGVTVATEWKNADGDVVTTAAAAGTYTGKVTVTAKPGYKLADEVNYTVNGEAATVETLGAEIEVKAAPVEGEIVVSIDTTGAGELATVKVTKSDGTEIKNGDTVKAGDRLTVDAAAAEAKSTAASDDKEIKIVVTAAAKEMPVKVSYVDGSGATLNNYNNADVTVTVDGAAPTATTTAKAGSKITATLKANAANAVTVKVNGTEVKFDEKGVAEYVVTDTDTKLEVEVVVAAKVTLTLTPAATNVMKDITLNGEKETVSGTSSVTFQVAPGSEIELTITKGTAAKAVLYAEIDNGDGKVWAENVTGDTVTLKLDSISANTTYKLKTSNGELTVKERGYTSPAGIVWDLVSSSINSANPEAWIKLNGNSSYSNLVAREDFNSLLSTLFVGAGDAVVCNKVMLLDGTEYTAPRPTEDMLANIDYFVCTAGDKTFNLKVKQGSEKTPVNVIFKDSIVDTVTPGSSKVITIDGMTANARYTIKTGASTYYVVNGSGALAVQADDTEKAQHPILTGTSISFTVPDSITESIVVTDGLYAVTPVDNVGDGASATYVAEGDDIGVKNFTTSKGSYFTVTTGTGANTVYYDADGNKQTTPCVIGLSNGTGSTKDFVAKMPAADGVKVTAKYWKVTGADGADVSALFADAAKATLVKVDDVVYAPNSAALIDVTGDAPILITPADGSTQTLVEGEDGTITGDCKIEQGDFTKINKVDSKTNYYLASADLDFAKLAEELGLSDNSYVIIYAGADVSGKKATKVSDGKLVDGSATIKDCFIKVSDLTSELVIDSNSIADSSYVEVYTGYVSLTVDAKAFDATGRGNIAGAKVNSVGDSTEFKDGVALTAGEETVIFVKDGAGASLTLVAGNRFMLDGVEIGDAATAVTKGIFVEGNTVLKVTNVPATPADPSVTE